ncbi:hypothetical protein [uncultured Albimonas sp.]|uniref:hypothetical protein n=1 Tax=uncultured Albimonas sp. TaxID=1331701 RepID=UPI0030EC6B54
MSEITLLMPLLDEGTPVWRAVAAQPLPDGAFRILGPAPGGERWAFPPGAHVAARTHVFADGTTRRVAAPLPA